MNIEEYERTGRHRYAEFAEVVASILKAAITACGGMRPQDIQRRAKDAESLRRKLARDGRERSDAIEDDVKDLAGARLVFYTNNDVHRFGQASILSDNFDVDYDLGSRWLGRRPEYGQYPNGLRWADSGRVPKLRPLPEAVPQPRGFA